MTNTRPYPYMRSTWTQRIVQPQGSSVSLRVINRDAVGPQPTQILPPVNETLTVKLWPFNSLKDNTPLTDAERAANRAVCAGCENRNQSLCGFDGKPAEAFHADVGYCPVDLHPHFVVGTVTHQHPAKTPRIAGRVPVLPIRKDTDKPATKPPRVPPLQPGKVKDDKPLNADELRRYFDRVVCISLRRRDDRREELRENIDTIDGGWPLHAIEYFDAIDGRVCPCPHGWTAGPGAWGCMQSHRHVLERALMDGIDRLLVLEDDVGFYPNFTADLASFLARVPDDWEQIMLGGEKRAELQEKKIADDIICFSHVERTHAYALRGDAIRDLYQHWVSTAGHCDHRMGDWQEGQQGRENIHRCRRVYAPWPWLAYQRGGKSDIKNAVKRREVWGPSRDIQPKAISA